MIKSADDPLWIVSIFLLESILNRFTNQLLKSKVNSFNFVRGSCISLQFRLILRVVVTDDSRTWGEEHDFI